MRGNPLGALEASRRVADVQSVEWYRHDRPFCSQPVRTAHHHGSFAEFTNLITPPTAHTPPTHQPASRPVKQERAPVLLTDPGGQRSTLRYPCHTQVGYRHLRKRETISTTKSLPDLMSGYALKGAAQLTLFSPKKNPSLKLSVSNVILLSLITSCCFAISSNHFFLPITVLAHNVKTYPFRPKCINVIGYPFLLSDLSGKGKNPFSRSFSSLFENEFRLIIVWREPLVALRLEAESSWAATTRSSRGIG